MPELVVRRFLSGVDRPTALDLSGYPPHPELGLTIDWIGADGEIALHLNARPRQHAVVLNAWDTSAWGDEVVLSASPFLDNLDIATRIRFEVHPGRFAIRIGEDVLADFPHRVPPDRIRYV